MTSPPSEVRRAGRPTIERWEANTEAIVRLAWSRVLGLADGALATNDALDAGLVPQWRTRSENSVSRSIARRLGFVEVGSQTTVVLARQTPIR